MAHPANSSPPATSDAKQTCGKRLRCAAALLTVALFSCGGVSAQTAEFTQNSPGTNSMNLQVPIAGYPGRGASLPINLYYSSKVWRIGFLKSVYAHVSGYNIPRSTAEAIYAEHSASGWTSSLDIPKVEWPKYNDVYNFNGKAYPRGPTYSPYIHRIARVFIHMPDGSTHEFRESDQAYPAANGIDVVGTFWAVDGSRMRYDSTNATTGTLYLADGTRYVLNGSTAQYIDRNGNTLNYNATSRQWTDTLGRVIGQPLAAVPSYGDTNYVVPGQNGGTTTYILKWRSLSEVLTQAQSLKAASDYYLPNPSAEPTDHNGNNFPQSTGGAASHFHSDYSDWEQESSYTYVIGRGQAGSAVFNPVVLSEIVLPNGQSYKFTYNNLGEIDKVLYPTGAYQRYEYGPILALTPAAAPFDQGSRGVTSRWVSANGTGGTDEVQWTYQTLGSPYRIRVTTPNGVVSETYLHNSTVFGNSSFGHEDARMGQPYEERVYASPGGAMLRRSLIEYARTSATFTRPSPGQGTYTAYRNSRPIKNVSLILDTGGAALLTGTTSQYDDDYEFTVGLDRTQSAEYAYSLVDQTTAQTGAISAFNLGSALRSTETTFLTSNVNYRTRNILGLVDETKVLNSAGGIVSHSAFDYDQYSLIQYGTVPQWTDPQTTHRGNLTTVSHWLNHPTPTWISTHTEYDQCGNVKSVTDALNRTSYVDYASTYSYAYPTTATSAVPDSVGTHGQPTAFVSTSNYDFNTGLVTSTTDANGRTTSFEYNDPLNRIRKVTRPDGGWTSTDYSDVPGNNYVRTQVLQHTSPTEQVMEWYQFFDKSGRASRSFTNEGSTYLTADTEYDNLGRVCRVSNPYRTTSLTDPVNPASLWTTTTYDLLSRPEKVKTSDNAEVTTAYGANLTSPYFGTTVTASDQTGNTRKSITDAQGRLVQLIEDPDDEAYQTNYTYDTLNNLRKVEQDSQLRYFGYDSFSRVIRARNVEQTVNSALAWTDPVTGYSGWTAAVSYDAAGNVSSRTDARNLTTDFTYDALNRVTTVRYSSGTQTPGVDNYYDGYRDGVNHNLPDSRGRVWQVETLGEVRVTVDQFDVMGRTAIQRQQFWTSGAWGASYEVKQTLNLAGQMIGLEYPSDRTVSYEYDQSGRLKTFTGNLGGVSRTYANEFQYNQWGGLQQEKFGTSTPLYHKQRFNQRGQLWDVRLSTVAYSADPANGDRGALVNYYSGNYTQGGSGTDNNGQVLRQENYIPGGSFYQQTYAYDSLNRLDSVIEKLNGTGDPSFIQAYTYDRFGNRTVNAQTTPNVPRPTYTVDTSTNRLTAPGGYNYAYDAAGNQTNDTYTGGGLREFDAENRMTRAQGNGQWQDYRYSGGGKRVRRIVNNVETWQIYGIGGELIAEYAAGGAVGAPQKEYGYRGGQLLITAIAGVGWGAPPTIDENPLEVGVTPIRSVHITQLRTAINAVRTNLGRTAYSWTPLGEWIKADPIVEMRIALDDALGPPNPAYAPGLEQGHLIKAVHIQELRNRVLAAWNTGGTVDIRWLVTDHLGTPRIIADQSGSSAGIRRRDYLPFGEEIGLIAGREAPQGYVADNTRQKFTGYEFDDETDLNFAQARYQSSQQGRFISVDPLGASATIVDPQTFNRYSYVSNDPINLMDPTGMMQAYQSWNDVSNGFWGSAFNPNLSHHGGPEQVSQAMVRNDLMVSVNQFFNKLPSDATYIGGLTWGWTDWSNLNIDGAPMSESASFDPSRGLDPYFYESTGFGEGFGQKPTGFYLPQTYLMFQVGTTYVDLKGNATPYPQSQSTTGGHGGGGAGDSWEEEEDVWLYRYGLEPESAAKLGSDAARAEKAGFPHGVSVSTRPKAGHPRARSYDVGRYFQIQKTGRDAHHYTVILPKPVTASDASLFNQLFRARLP